MSERTTAGPRPAGPAAAAEDATIRPFRVSVPDEDPVELRRRIDAYRWPERETVDDDSQGVQLATMQELARYWATECEWRKVEAKLNALPLVVSHGWPGSIIEQLKIIEPLTNPTDHGGSAADAFDVVIPSLPGYGFSGKPAATGWGPDRIAGAWAVLMDRLGYTRYVAQGGDWAPRSRPRWRARRPRGCSASTSTSRRWSRSRCSVTSATAILHRPASRTRNSALTSRSRSRPITAATA